MIKQETLGTLNKRKVFCNHYMSAFKWLSGKNIASSYSSAYDALKHHLKYIANHKRDDLALVYNDDLNKWKELTELELSRRYDARIACKFFATLPNDLSNQEALDLVKEFLEKEVKSQFFTIAIHRNLGVIENKENLHAHVVFYARDLNGKKIKFSKRELYNIRRKWEEHLENRGFVIKTAPWRGRIRVNLYQNSRLNEPEIQYIKSQRQVWALMTKAINEEKSFREKEEERKRKRKEEERKRTEPLKRETEQKNLLRDITKRILNNHRRGEGRETEEGKQLKINQNKKSLNSTIPRLN